jgi:hypothetical protein
MAVEESVSRWRNALLIYFMVDRTARFSFRTRSALDTGLKSESDLHPIPTVQGRGYNGEAR